jgi:hypothetical protein
LGLDGLPASRFYLLCEFRGAIAARWRNITLGFSPHYFGLSYNACFNQFVGELYRINP